MVALTEILSVPEGKRAPLLVEVPIAKELDGPFLVTSTKGLLWVQNKFINSVVRAVVKKVPPDFMYRDMIIEVHKKSEASGWESVSPPTAEGLKAAISHLQEYEFTQVEVLVGAEFDTTVLGSTKFVEATWVPKGWAVVIPSDRSFVGTAIEFGEGLWAGVLHNASRGIALLAPYVAPPLPTKGVAKKAAPKKKPQKKVRKG